MRDDEYKFVFGNCGLGLSQATPQRSEWLKPSCVAVLPSVKKLLTEALNKNEYLKRLEVQQIRDMVECMYQRSFQQGQFVLQQGQPGHHLFVLAGNSPKP